MTDKHTPGPWQNIGEDEYAPDCPMIEIDNGKIGDGNWRSIAYAVADVDVGITDEDRANANLIAAAPDLLAALEAVLRSACEHPTDLDGEGRFAIRKATAAIARAKGKGQ